MDKLTETSSPRFHTSLYVASTLSIVHFPPPTLWPPIMNGRTSPFWQCFITLSIIFLGFTPCPALIFISNRLAGTDESDEVMLNNLKSLMSEIPDDVPLGFYECPFPYKRILSKKIVEFCAESGRFYFLKDTSCDIKNIREKLEIIKGSRMKLYNANSATLLESLRAGASGYSGVMANFHPELYAWLLDNWKEHPEKAEYIQDILTMCSFIELKNYPLNAKAYLKESGFPVQLITRKNVNDNITETEISEIHQMKQLSERALEMVKKEE